MSIKSRIFLGVVGAGVSFAAWLVWAYYQPSVMHQQFESHTWKDLGPKYSEVVEPGCYRGGMALDVVQRRLLSGKSQNEVIDLLGSPERRQERKAMYEVGQCSGFGWENSQLVVEFKADGKVDNARFTKVDF